MALGVNINVNVNANDFIMVEEGEKKHAQRTQLLNTIICLNYSFGAVVLTRLPSLFYTLVRLRFDFTHVSVCLFLLCKAHSLNSYIGHAVARSNFLISVDKINHHSLPMFHFY